MREHTKYPFSFAVHSMPASSASFAMYRRQEQGIDLLCENTQVSLMAVRDIGDTTYAADRRRPEYTPHFGQIRIRKRHF
jgi:hypothetical protein